MSIESWSALGVFLILLVTAKNRAWPLFGKNAHPLGFVLLYQIGILTLPGILIVSFSSDCLGSITCSIITQPIKDAVFRDYFVVLSIVFIAFVNAYQLSGEKNLFRPTSNGNRQFLILCVALTVGIVVLRISFSSGIPIVLALQGDFAAAELQKAAILKGEAGLSVPIFNFFLKYFPYYSFYSCAIAYMRKRCPGYLVLISFLVTAVALTYDLQKGPLVIAIAGMFWLIWSIKGSAKYIMAGAILSIGIAALLFYISFDFGGNFQYFLDSIANRLFVAQIDGMYWVYQFLDQPHRYQYWGIPLAKMFSLEQVDPLADVIPYVFPDAPESWVNTTTFIAGEAKAIFGDYGWIASGFAILVNILLLCKISTYLQKKNAELFYPAIFTMTYTFPLANNLTDLLYGRFILGFCLFMIFPTMAFFLHRALQAAIGRYADFRSI